MCQTITSKWRPLHHLSASSLRSNLMALHLPDCFNVIYFRSFPPKNPTGKLSCNSGESSDKCFVDWDNGCYWLDLSAAIPGQVSSIIDCRGLSLDKETSSDQNEQKRQKSCKNAISKPQCIGWNQIQKWWRLSKCWRGRCLWEAEDWWSAAVESSTTPPLPHSVSHSLPKLHLVIF